MLLSFLRSLLSPRFTEGSMVIFLDFSGQQNITIEEWVTFLELEVQILLLEKIMSLSQRLIFLYHAVLGYSEGSSSKNYWWCHNKILNLPRSKFVLKSVCCKLRNTKVVCVRSSIQSEFSCTHECFSYQSTSCFCCANVNLFQFRCLTWMRTLICWKKMLWFSWMVRIFKIREFKTWSCKVMNLTVKYKVWNAVAKMGKQDVGTKHVGFRNCSCFF